MSLALRECFCRIVTLCFKTQMSSTEDVPHIFLVSPGRADLLVPQRFFFVSAKRWRVVWFKNDRMIRMAGFSSSKRAKQGYFFVKWYSPLLLPKPVHP